MELFRRDIILVHRRKRAKPPHIVCLPFPLFTVSEWGSVFAP